MNIPKSVIPVTSTIKDERSAYQKSSKDDLRQLINDLELTDLHKHSLRSRWLDQVSWMGKKARHCQRWYYILRLIAIIGGVIVPALVGLNLTGNQFAGFVQSTTLGLSMIVAISLATE